MDSIISLIVFFILLCIGYFSGSYAEKRHFRKIILRERSSRDFPMITTKNIDHIQGIEESMLVMGGAVVSVDYFKRFLAGIRNLFGGSVIAYESLMDRGRREAILRMKHQAIRQGFHMIVNVKLLTASIGKIKGNKNSVKCVDVMAYGTALRIPRGG